jgi:hypothetical protein
VFGELVRHSGDLILNVEFVDVADGTQLWGAQIREDCQQGIDRSEHFARVILQHLQPILSSNRKAVVAMIRKPAPSASQEIDDQEARKEA